MRTVTNPHATLVANSLVAFAFIFIAAPVAAQNLVPNPTFEGTGGAIGGTVNAPNGVPDNWRAFGVGGGAVDLEVIPGIEDEIFPGSPAVNFVSLRVTTFGADQAFDDDNGRFDLLPGVDYHAEVWIKSGNADESDQQFNIGFPLFGAGGAYLGREPGGLLNQVATDEWQLFVAPTFRDSDVLQGHISFRCLDDGDENSILIALPSVEQEGDAIVPPTGLTCVRTGANVELTWQNNGEYESIRVERGGEVLDELDPDVTSYVDEGIPLGVHDYQVIAVAPDLEDGPTCQIVYAEVAVGTTVSVDLGDIDIEDGLVNSQRQDGTDGENEFVICGPAGEEREARSNLGADDPTPDAADGLFYFSVTDPDMKAQTTFKLTATVYDDPALAGTGLALQYTNSLSTGPGDLPNTFFPLETRFLEGLDEWVELSWQIADAGFRNFQQGSSDFRLNVIGGTRVCIDRVDLVYVPLVTALNCETTPDGVELTWENGGAYDSIQVLRDDLVIVDLPGDATSYLDDEVDEGLHLYEVVAAVDDVEISAECEITVFFVEPGTRVSVDLGDIDAEDGLSNLHRMDGTDGENEFLDCGPAGDDREVRSNLAGLDDDDPDGFFYFTVTDEPMKAQREFRLEATVYDDPALADVGLFLQYTNSSSTGPGDIPNTFFPQADPETNILAGTDEWVTLSWTIPDAGFRSFQQGDSDFRIGVTGGASVCVDAVELIYGAEEPPTDPVFHRGDVNADGQINITDPVAKLNYLFGGSTAPPCFDAADANDDGALNITGAVFELNWLFAGGPEPLLPGPADLPCGPDPTPDELVNADCVYDSCTE